MKIFPIFLAFALVGCSTHTVRQPDLLMPPSTLLEECEATPIEDVKTNVDLVFALQAARLDLDMCNNQLASLRDWYDTMQRRLNRKE